MPLYMGMPATLPIDWDEIRRAAEMGVDAHILAKRYNVDVGTIHGRASRHQWLTPKRIAQLALIQRETRRELDSKRVLSVTGETNGVSWFKPAVPKAQDPGWWDDEESLPNVMNSPGKGGGENLGGTMELSAFGVARRPDSLPLFVEKAKKQELAANANIQALVAETWETRGESIRELAWQIGQKSLGNVLRNEGIMLTNAKDVRSMVTMMREATGVFRDDHVPGLSVFGGHHADDMENVIDVSGPVTETTMDADGWW